VAQEGLHMVLKGGWADDFVGQVCLS